MGAATYNHPVLYFYLHFLINNIFVCFRNDLAYFDGLGEVIISVGLVKPKPSVFYPCIKYLLVLTTTVEIVVLGVKFAATKPDGKSITFCHACN